MAEEFGDEIDRLPPSAGALLLTVAKGCGVIGGRPPSGQLAKKGAARVIIDWGDWGVSSGEGKGENVLTPRMNAL
jgi:hypothetical protein